MIKRLFVFLFFCIPLFLQAQYTTVINSNRPGLSESPYSVGSGVYQFESSLFYRKVPITETFSNPQSIGLNLLFRTSFLSEKLEVNLNTSLSKDKIAFKNIFTSSYDKTGLSQFTLAAKYLVYAPKYDDKSKEIRSWKARHSFDWKRWIPHVGVYAGLNFGSFLTDFHNRGDISPKVGILLQNEFSDKLNVITNLYYNNIGSDFSEYSYIVTGTYNFDDYWSGFAELQGIFEKYETKSSIGAGAAYLFSENLQFNASIRANLERKEMGLTSTIGVSYRLNRHEDDFAEIDEFGNKIEEDKPIKYDENRSFFGRLFSKIGRLFKKNKDKDKKVDLDISPDKKDTEVREKPRRKREESLIDLLSKEDAKLKKKTSKEEKKAAKKAQKQAEKEKRRQEKEKEKALKQQEKERLKLAKEKEKEEERKEKERLKLEKEIKKLEEEIKEEEDEEKDDQ
ncbi:transporter [Tenacibaculum sp. 190524A02b]|uniref:MetA-pathway of phenol degradation n=1 Tax=Tenacibaculum vairaonense TaxID=3137860 RepID=A0ABM9PHN3_9FLAO